MRIASLWLCSLVVGCGTVPAAPDAAVDGRAADAAVDAAPTRFTVSVTVDGVVGPGLVLRLAGSTINLPILGNGTFTFPGTLPDGAGYDMMIVAQPMCPQRFCMTTNGEGTISGANANISLGCSMPRYQLVSHNWGSPAGIRITDDVLAHAHDATATPRILTGSNTTLANSEIDSVAVDRMRGLIYAPAQTTVPDLAVLVFTSSTTTSQDVAPLHRFTIDGETSFEGVELDEGADRLYLSGGSGKLYVIDNASTSGGAVTPSATIPLAGAGALTLDRKHDRLYVGAPATWYVFDNARQLSSTSREVKKVTWSAPIDHPRSLAIDACRNRLYVSFRNATSSGNVFAFDGASSLDGTIDLATASAARLTVPGNQVLSTALDSSGHFYFWKDSATLVNIINAPHLLSGAVTVIPDRVIHGVVDRGYGLDVVSHPP
jgi:hypothetical protein